MNEWNNGPAEELTAGQDAAERQEIAAETAQQKETGDLDMTQDWK